MRAAVHVRRQCRSGQTTFCFPNTRRYAFVPTLYSPRVYSTACATHALRKPFTIYVHWPYCLSKCTYCNFNKYVEANPEYERITHCLLAELTEALQDYHHRTVHSIYFGGGTPSLAPPSTVAQLIELVGRTCHVPQDIEITLEANPTSMETQKLRQFREAGVNRLSMGIQALNDQALRFLGRNHSTKEALEALTQAQKLFSHVLTFDLIYGRPDQTVEQWGHELRQALALGSHHVSLYELTLKRGTALYRAYERGDYVPVSSDRLADLYEHTIAMCAEFGLVQYEVSNFARWCDPLDLVGLSDSFDTRLNRSLPAQSKHNTAYWRGLDYIGIGPGAHGRITDSRTGSRVRTYRIPHPPTWMKQCDSLGHGLRKQSLLTGNQTLEELVVFGLRMREGLPDHRFQQYSNGLSLRDYLKSDVVDRLVEANLIEWVHNPKLSESIVSSETLRPTEKGLAVIDGIIPRLLP